MTKKIFKSQQKTTQRTPSTNDDVGTTTREGGRGGRGDAADDGESFETTRPHRLPFVFFISGGERVFGTIRESDFTEHFDDDKNERVFSR